MSTPGTAEPIAAGSDTAAISHDDLTALFEQGAFQAGDTPEPEEETSEVVQTKAVEPIEEQAQEPEADEIDDFLSNLDDESRKDLASRLGGRLGSELGRMRAELREARAVNDAEAAKREPFQRKQESNNPYSKETDLKSLETTYDSAQAVIKDGEKTLRRYRNADPDDEVEFGGQMLTITQIEEYVETAREARENHIPERVRQLRESEGLESARIQNLEKVKGFHPWLAEDGELKSAFESVRDRYLPSVRDHIPDILPYFDQMLADHFAAVQQRTAPPTKEPATRAAERPRQRKPPGSPGGSAAASARPASSDARRSKILESFTSTGQSMSQDDLAQFLLTK